MKAPKVLRYDWADLTGLEELDSNEMEELRLMFREMSGCHDLIRKNVLEAFFLKNATYLLSKPTSDTCVILYRLLEQELKETLNNNVAIAMTLQCVFSMGQFVDLVTESFFFTKRPIPIVSGTPPRIWL